MRLIPAISIFLVSGGAFAQQTLPDLGSSAEAKEKKSYGIPAAEILHVRCERQTLRRLPRTGAVVFTIRVWVNPLREIAADPERLARFAQAWRTAHPDFRDDLEREARANGLIPKSFA